MNNPIKVVACLAPNVFIVEHTEYYIQGTGHTAFSVVKNNGMYTWDSLNVTITKLNIRWNSGERFDGGSLVGVCIEEFKNTLWE